MNTFTPIFTVESTITLRPDTVTRFVDSFSITSLGEAFDRDDRLSSNLYGRRLYGSDRDSGSGRDGGNDSGSGSDVRAAALERCDGSHHGLSDPGSLDETGEPLQDYLVVRMGGNPWCTGRARHLTCFKRNRRPFKVAILCPSNGSPSNAPSNAPLQKDTHPPSFASSSTSSSSSSSPSSSSSSSFPSSSPSPHCAIDTNKGSQSVCAIEDNEVKKEPCERDCLNCSPGCQNHYINNHLCDSVCFRSNCAFDDRDCAWAFDDATRGG